MLTPFTIPADGVAYWRQAVGCKVIAGPELFVVVARNAPTETPSPAQVWLLGPKIIRNQAAGTYSCLIPVVKSENGGHEIVDVLEAHDFPDEYECKKWHREQSIALI